MIGPYSAQLAAPAKRQSFQDIAASDVIGEPMSHHRFITAVFRFAAEIKKLSPEQNIGMLLPISARGWGVIANMAVLSLSKTVVNINFTASAEAIKSSVEQAGLKKIYTSRRFLDKLKERNVHIPGTFCPTRRSFSLEDGRKASPSQTAGYATDGHAAANPRCNGCTCRKSTWNQPPPSCFPAAAKVRPRALSFPTAIWPSMRARWRMHSTP
ncbi:MAG: hypothetical protein R3E93_04610 [Thiothrix sp.]